MSTDSLRPVAILWDIENCAVPHGVNAEVVAVHIRMALKIQLAVKGPISVFSAYGDFSHISRLTRLGCQKTGVNLIDIPHEKKDAADKAILVDMFLFALDNPPPCTIVLISGDVDFAPALHKLGQRGYCVVLAIPSGPKVSPALCSACQYLWSWPDIAHGKGLRTAKAPFMCTIKDDQPLEMVGLNVKGDCIDQKTGINHAKYDTIDGVDDTYHSFPNLGGSSSHDQIGYETLTKIPVNIFEERIKVPFEFLERPVATGMEYKVTEAFDRDRSLFPPSSGTTDPVTSSGMTSYENMPPSTSQGMNFGVACCKFSPPGGQYQCDWFATPHPGGASAGAHVAGKQGTYLDLGGPITRSQKVQKDSTNSKCSKPGSKQAVHAKGEGQSLQLKVKKKKMKKTQDKCAVVKLWKIKGKLQG